MSTDVFGSYLAVTEYLSSRAFAVQPEGIYLHIVDTLTGEILLVADTIDEICEWVQKKFNVNLLKEDVCPRTVDQLALRST